MQMLDLLFQTVMVMMEVKILNVEPVSMQHGHGILM